MGPTDENEVRVARGVPFSGGVSQHLGTATSGRRTVVALYGWAGNEPRDNTPALRRGLSGALGCPPHAAGTIGAPRLP